MLKLSILVLATTVLLAVFAAPSVPGQCSGEKDQAELAICVGYLQKIQNSSDLNHITFEDRTKLDKVNEICTNSITCIKKFESCGVKNLDSFTTFQVHCSKLAFLTSPFYDCAKNLEKQTKVPCIGRLVDVDVKKIEKNEKCEQLVKDEGCIKDIAKKECKGDFTKEIKEYTTKQREIFECK